MKRFLSRVRRHVWLIGAVSLIALLLVGGIVYESVRLDEDQFDLPSGLSLYSRDGQLLHTYLNHNEQLLIPIKLENVHDNMISALVASEDERFYSHPGVDPLAIGRATVTNIRHGSIQSGASTITMQLARMLDPANRTFFNKFIESLRAIQIDRRWSKERIMEAYLNRLPFGGNVKGVETAARVYFDKVAGNLSIAESAYLAAIPKDPVRLNPLRHHERVLRKQVRVLKRMVEEGYISDSEYREARADTIKPTRHPLPFETPHLTEHLRNRGRTGHTETTVDLSFQHQIERIADDYVKGLENHNIHNLSVVVLDNETREVLAYLGSQDFHDDKHAGQVQGPYAIRSPGSTLKPFLYVRAFVDGHATPSTTLADVPTRYVGLAPENYDREFRGRVTASRALKQSLNVPAVRLLNHYGLGSFKQFLEKIGFRHLEHEPDYYGLSLILGGVGVNLMELTNAYATLASGGIHRRPSFVKRSKPDGRPMYPRSGSYLVSHILKADESVFGAFPFAYKTGTSANHRDAWTVGWNPEITVGVWTGNFDGTHSKYLMGRRSALPLVKKIFRARYPDKSGPWYDRPPSVRKRTVCTVSGKVPNPTCPSQTEGLYIRDRSSSEECQVHEKIFVSKDERLSYCSGCITGHDYKTKVIERHSPAVTRFLKVRGMQKYSIPQHNPTCPYYQTQWTDLSIVSPTNGATFVRSGQSEIPVRVATSGTDQPVYLFMDDEFMDSVSPEETVFVNPDKGKHRITAVDYTGNAVTHSFEVD